MGFLMRRSLIERLGQETGWQVMRRDEGIYQLQARKAMNIRYLNARFVEERKFIWFWGRFPVRIPIAQATTDFYSGLLARNRNRVLSNWSIEIVGAVEIQPYFHCTVPRAGLDAATFHLILQEQVDEIDALYNLLRSQLTSMANVLIPAQAARHSGASVELARSLPPVKSGPKGIQFLE